MAVSNNKDYSKDIFHVGTRTTHENKTIQLKANCVQSHFEKEKKKRNYNHNYKVRIKKKRRYLQNEVRKKEKILEIE